MASFEKKLDPSIKTICHIGIGGSIVGPKFIYHSLKTWKQKECIYHIMTKNIFKHAKKYQFIHNIIYHSFKIWNNH